MIACTCDLLQVVPAYISSKSFDPECFFTAGSELTRAVRCRRVDVNVVDPMIFQDHSRNCYVKLFRGPAVKVKAYLEANRNLHK